MGATNMAYHATDVPDLSKVTNMRDMFNGAASFDQPLDWNTSSVTNMAAMFRGADSFNGNITKWDTSSVTNMVAMFSNAGSFNGSITKWDTSSVTSMGSMFSNAGSFNGNITKWVTSSATDMNFMFSNAASFDQPLDWNTSSVTNMIGMFQGAASFNGSITKWDTSSVTSMGSMFQGAASFNGNITKWDTSSVTGMAAMFQGADSFNGNITKWVTSSVTSMAFMFSNTDSFDQPLDWDTSSVTNMGSMFSNTVSFDQPLDWNTSSVTNMAAVFHGAASFNGNITKWDTSSVLNMDDMFSNAASFDQPLGVWKVSSVTTMSRMFSGANAFDQNLGAWYIMLDSTAIDRTNIPGMIGQISPQNKALDNQRPVYDTVPNIDSARFVIDSNLLKMTSITPAKATYIVNITATGSNVFENGNNWRAFEVTVNGDVVLPAPSLATDSPSPTNAASVTVTVDFGEPINPATFTLDDISVTGGDASVLAQEGATTQKYTFTVTPSSDGQLTVTIPADSVKDLAGNNNTASGQLPVTFDRTTPGPTLSTTETSPTNAASVTVTVDFGEPINPATFTLDDISVTGGDASVLAQEGATTQKYTFTVTPSSDGQLTVTIPADRVMDLAGNNNTASGPLPVTFDRTGLQPRPVDQRGLPDQRGIGHRDSRLWRADRPGHLHAGSDVSVTGGTASSLTHSSATTRTTHSP